MAFMQPEVTDYDMWIEIDGTHGITMLPADLDPHLYKTALTSSDGLDEEILERAQTYYEGKVQSVAGIKGYGARLSAPGYMDCTEWTVFDTREEAVEYLRDNYLDDEDDDVSLSA